jgi:hypothetical protein
MIRTSEDSLSTLIDILNDNDFKYDIHRVNGNLEVVIHLDVYRGKKKEVYPVRLIFDSDKNLKEIRCDI